MNKTIKELVDLMDSRGLSAEKFTRVERVDGKKVPDWYNPASDIVNLFPCLLSVAINDLESEYPDDLVDNITGQLLKQLLPVLYREMPQKGGDCTALMSAISRSLQRLREEFPEPVRKVSDNFLLFSLLAYALGTKNGLREMPTVMGGNGVFRYFAFLAIWDKLKPETQKAVVNDLAGLNLWGADPDAI